MNEHLETGYWHRVKAGPQRNQMGVLESSNDFAVGRRYRLVDPRTRAIVGRFPSEMLERCDAPPAHESSVDIAPLLDIVMGRGRS